MAVAISSLPVPVSPSSSTEALLRATCRVVRYTSSIAGLEPMMPGMGGPVSFTVAREVTGHDSVEPAKIQFSCFGGSALRVGASSVSRMEARTSCVPRSRLSLALYKSYCCCSRARVSSRPRRPTATRNAAAAACRSASGCSCGAGELDQRLLGARGTEQPQTRDSPGRPARA